MREIVRFTAFERANDTKVRGTYDVSWAKAQEIFTEHSVRKSKDGHMFTGWVFEDGYNRDRDSASTLEMLCLDIDGEIDLEKAFIRFRQYEHVMYTSWGHQTESKNYKDCFRLVFPLAQPISKLDYENRKDALKFWSGRVDQSCLSISRAFYFPSCSVDNAAKAFTWKNTGQWFDIYSLPENIPYEPPPIPYNPVTDKQKAKMIEDLKGVFLGSEPEWMKVCVAMIANDFSCDDFIAVTLGGMMKEKSADDAKKKWEYQTKRIRSKPGINYGYLVNLVKENK